MTAAVERRNQPRMGCSRAGHGSHVVRLRTGQHVTPIDECCTGLGFETSTRVVPGCAVDLLLNPGAGGARRGRVVHASVCRLHPTGGVVYRIGVRFDEPCQSPQFGA